MVTAFFLGFAAGAVAMYFKDWIIAKVKGE